MKKGTTLKNYEEIELPYDFSDHIFIHIIIIL